MGLFKTTVRGLIKYYAALDEHTPPPPMLLLSPDLHPMDAPDLQSGGGVVGAKMLEIVCGSVLMHFIITSKQIR